MNLHSPELAREAFLESLRPDAIRTLLRFRGEALAKVERLNRRLEDERDELPRGPLPVMTKISHYETAAFHLDMALAALGHPMGAAG